MSGNLKSKLSEIDNSKRLNVLEQVYVLAIQYELRSLGTALDPVHQNTIWYEDYAALFDKAYSPKKTPKDIFEEIQRERGIVLI